MVPYADLFNHDASRGIDEFAFRRVARPSRRRQLPPKQHDDDSQQNAEGATPLGPDLSASATAAVEILRPLTARPVARVRGATVNGAALPTPIEEEDEFVVTATRPFRKGDQVLLCYTHSDHWHFVKMFGFVPSRADVATTTAMVAPSGSSLPDRFPIRVTPPRAASVAQDDGLAAITRSQLFEGPDLLKGTHVTAEGPTVKLLAATRLHELMDGELDGYPSAFDKHKRLSLENEIRSTVYTMQLIHAAQSVIVEKQKTAGSVVRTTGDVEEDGCYRYYCSVVDDVNHRDLFVLTAALDWSRAKLKALAEERRRGPAQDACAAGLGILPLTLDASSPPRRPHQPPPLRSDGSVGVGSPTTASRNRNESTSHMGAAAAAEHTTAGRPASYCAKHLRRRRSDATVWIDTVAYHHRIEADEALKAQHATLFGLGPQLWQPTWRDDTDDGGSTDTSALGAVPDKIAPRGTVDDAIEALRREEQQQHQQQQEQQRPPRGLAASTATNCGRPGVVLADEDVCGQWVRRRLAEMSCCIDCCDELRERRRQAQGQQ